MEAGAREYDFELLEPAKLVRVVVDDFSQEISERGYRVEITDCDRLPAVRADQEALSRALWNLLDNAVKYSPHCRTIWVETAREDGQVAIRVRDQGLGVAPHEHRQIFKKFVRATSAKTAGARGTGLGLAMVQHIVSAHGGEVRVSNQPSGGSMFTMLLPPAKE